jgi:hypothetical protein
LFKSKFRAAILQQWIWSSMLCKLAPFSTTLNKTVSILTLVVITFDRFYIINYPLRKKLTKQRCLLVIFLIWCISLFMSSYELVNFNVNVYNESEKQSVYLIKICEMTETRHAKSYFIALFAIQYLIPFVSLAFTIVAIVKIIHFCQDFKLISRTSKFSTENKKKV